MKLHKLASVLRSKSAGPFRNTFDIFFAEEEPYRRVKSSKVLTRESIAQLYHIRPEDVFGIYFVDGARGIKITIPKSSHEATGDPACRDIYGAQQYIPLLDIEVP
jgi:hypothetical protein